MNPTAPVDRYAVIGNPIAHSLSPYIHGEFARQTSQHMDYGRLLCQPGEFDSCLLEFANAGGRGCNVTMPFKFDAYRLATRRTARADLACAANVMTLAEGGWSADNTDGSGLLRDIESGAKVTVVGQRVLLIGAGGAAAGVLGPLLDARPAELTLVNRTLDKAEALALRHQPLAAERGVHLQVAPISSPGLDHDIVINASASSLQGAASPVPTDVFRPGALAVDLSYGASALPFLAWAEAAGACGRDGLGMLVEQAALAFQAWRGARPDTAPVLQALRQRLAQAR